jgi:uncharacterized membrane protein
MATDRRPVVIPVLLRVAAALRPVPAVLALLAFAAALTPSLVPRPTPIQGVLCGLSLGAGYAIGLGLRAVWLGLQLPVPPMRVARWMASGAVIGALAIAVAALLQSSVWQNRLRALMDLAPVETARPLTIALVAAAVFAALWLLTGLFRWMAGGL